MPDRLIRSMPPMSNDWVVGLASGTAYDADSLARLANALDEGDTGAVDELMQVAVGAVEVANSSYFRFRVDTAVDPGEPRVVELSPSADSRALDLGLDGEHSTRKIVALVILDVAGDGVRLTLDGWAKTVDAVAGQIVMFPAYGRVLVDGPADSSVRVAALHAFGPAFQ